MLDEYIKAKAEYAKQQHSLTATGENLDFIASVAGLRRRWYEEIFESLFRNRLVKKINSCRDPHNVKLS
jgi:hypothetical protein